MIFDNDSDTLLYDVDLGPTKNATDVILNGHVVSPDEKRVASVPVGLRVGKMLRLARVYGDRIWDGKQYSEPEPFNRMSLVYNRMGRGNFYHRVVVILIQQEYRLINILRHTNQNCLILSSIVTTKLRDLGHSPGNGQDACNLPELMMNNGNRSRLLCYQPIWMNATGSARLLHCMPEVD